MRLFLADRTPRNATKSHGETAKAFPPQLPPTSLPRPLDSHAAVTGESRPMTRYLLALSLLLCSAAAAHAQAVPVYVFTQADPSGLVDDSTAERVTAVADIKARLAKNASVRVVETLETARVAVEVLRTGAEDRGDRSVTTAVTSGGLTVVNPGTTVYRFSGHARLTSGTFSTNLESSIGPFGRSYGENLGRKIEDWIKKNAKALGIQ